MFDSFIKTKKKLSWAIRLTIACVALLMGINGVFLFRWTAPDLFNPLPELIYEDAFCPLPAAEEPQNLNESTPEIKFTCSDENLRPVWGLLKVELEKDYAFLEYGTDCADFFRVEKKADLNLDGKQELLVKGILLGQCAPVGNCSFFVFTKNKKQYEPLLVEAGGSVQQFEIAETKTNGYKDLVLKSHGSWNTGNWDVYKFNGKKYEAKKCYLYEYKATGGATKVANTPTLARYKCFVE